MTAPRIDRIRCDNPSPMTLQGTITHVLGGARQVVIVDPGPADHPEHREAVAAAVAGREVSTILVTHRHGDHTGAAAEFARRFDAPVRGADPSWCLAAGGGHDDGHDDGHDGARGPSGAVGAPAPLTDGERLAVDGAVLVVVRTPGHTSDSVSFWVPDDPSDVYGAGGGAMLTGDTVLGSGTTMLDHPDGTLTDYLASLERLRAHGAARLLPAHGPERESLAAVVDDYLAHRRERLDQVRGLLAAHGPDLDAVALGRLIYGEDSGLPAGVTTKIAAAQLDHLHRIGER